MCHEAADTIAALRREVEEIRKDYRYMRETLDKRIDQLEAERRWIPFTAPADLPAEKWAPYFSDAVLVAICGGKNTFVKEERYDFKMGGWEKYSTGVTHRMPLPQPPAAQADVAGASE